VVADLRVKLLAPLFAQHLAQLADGTMHNHHVVLVGQLELDRTTRHIRAI
jgi:hypothetical protein